MLRLVAAAFELPYHRVGKASLLKSMEVYFQACVQEGKRVLLVVDEAQGLPRKSIEELRMLSNFHMNGRALLQTFMLGQREFRTTMRSEGFEQLRQRVIAAYHLKPLDEVETRGYIEHRLRTAGWRGDPQFTPDALSGVFEFTAGVPRRINTLCDRLLLYEYLEELHRIDEPALHAVARDIIEEQGGGRMRSCRRRRTRRAASMRRRPPPSPSGPAPRRRRARTDSPRWRVPSPHWRMRCAKSSHCCARHCSPTARVKMTSPAERNRARLWAVRVLGARFMRAARCPRP